MSLRVAFIGFRHNHINGLYSLAHERDGLEVVAACEEDPEIRAQRLETGIAITHNSYEAMLSEVPCDIVACGDYFGIRGERVIRALEHGRHVLCDKPLCTSLKDLERIEALARKKSLRVGCMLDLIDKPPLATLRELIRRGDIGEVLSMTVLGQHPLKYGSRPMWYFEEGKHGGTINDIGIHLIDALPWLTGHAIEEITAARGWNGRLKQHPHFEDGALLMLKLANGCGVMADFSYFSSDASGYAMPTYWRFTVAGTQGTAETGINHGKAILWPNEGNDPREIPLIDGYPNRYLDDFLADVAGTPRPGGLDTPRVVHSARVSLLAQQAAHTNSAPLTISP
ncbi:MAG: Gfo/Idh/MocA family oxidoreductase [Candidatus Hydrogenedentota bacterium]